MDPETEERAMAEWRGTMQNRAITIMMRDEQPVGDVLMARSQARRLMARLERFTTVLLDFTGVATIGQAFADEVFRVFSPAHPEITVVAINAQGEVAQMIRRVAPERLRTTGEAGW
jgi:hypothetical protein